MNTGIEVPIASETPQESERRLIVTVAVNNLTTGQEGILEIAAKNPSGHLRINTSLIVVGVRLAHRIYTVHIQYCCILIYFMQMRHSR